jgi:hypothetical protein
MRKRLRHCAKMHSCKCTHTHTCMHRYMHAYKYVYGMNVQKLNRDVSVWIRICIHAYICMICDCAEVMSRCKYLDQNLQTFVCVTYVYAEAESRCKGLEHNINELQNDANQRSSAVKQSQEQELKLLAALRESESEINRLSAETDSLQ